MGPAARGDIENSVEPRAVAENVWSLQRCGKLFVGRGIGRQSRRQLLRGSRDCSEQRDAREEEERIKFQHGPYLGSRGAVLYSAPMASLLRTIEFLGLSLWLGSDVFLSFVVAPGAFRILASRDHAGAIVGYGLWWMHMIGVVYGFAILLARLLRTRTFASFATPAALSVVLMILLTVVSQHAVSPKMAALRMQMGSIQATAADSPLLAEFSRLHRISVSLESGVLLTGFAAMYLMVKELSAKG